MLYENVFIVLNLHQTLFKICFILFCSLSWCLANVVNKWFSDIWGDGKLYSISGVKINSLRLSSTIKYLCFVGTHLSSLLQLIISRVFTPLMFCFFIHGLSNNLVACTSSSLHSTPVLIFRLGAKWWYRHVCCREWGLNK